MAGRREVALLIHDGVQALDVAGPLDVFAEANGFLPPDHGYDCLLVALDRRPMHASNGMPIAPHLTFAEAERRFHTVLVAGGPALPDAPACAATSYWLQRWAAQADRYGSVCTGAFTLGHAGLLDGRTATTHWQNAAQLAADFPAAHIEQDRIHARDGALVTSAGVTAGIDLALALVSEDHGEALALSCARRLVVVTQRQGGQSQFSALLLPHGDAESPIGRVQAHVMAHLTERFPVERLADIAGISTRTLARLFVQELGQTPHDFVQSVRLDHARNLLEATDRPLKAVAFDCGFAGPEQMRAVFQRRLGLSPLRYRESFQVPRQEPSISPHKVRKPA
ncbi:GlxA family transcriptional regulator [Sphingomonas sp. AP4-R1]|uniref:GlxA family transcriptional regulator n=1 Tax=Sphingomonas sp. AP4-R1 TaxID=2735134 RepID=UPI001493831D|nr:GlxA family transcriptional regulator [Sphingomonas sp. AP4-R1]QJU58131.1 GlxA family transcriptional regulator [Sphingomonas sp. AP4-R1]